MARKIPKTIKYLVHTTDLIKIPVEGRSKQEIIDDIGGHGMKMGMTSLRRLLAEEIPASCGFELMDLAPDDAAPLSDSKAEDLATDGGHAVGPTVDGDPFNPLKKGDEGAEEQNTLDNNLDVSPSTVAPLAIVSTFNKDVLAVANNVLAAVTSGVGSIEAEVTTTAPVATGTKIKPMRRGTKNESVFKMLCNGATVKEIAAALKWTEGAVSSVVFWEPNNKGYGLDKEKVEGRGTVNFLTIEGKRIGEADLVYSK